MRPRQLRLCRPAGKRPNVVRLTKRQDDLLAYLRASAEPVDAQVIGRVFGYRWPHAACQRLVKRGLADRVPSELPGGRAGLYRARVLRERKP